MQIGSPTTNLPQACSIRGKYTSVYQAVQKLKSGEWLPVKFANAHEAYNFRVNSSTGRRSGMYEVKLRGDMVYLRSRTTKNGKQVRG